jgi:hypothetical protein
VDITILGTGPNSNIEAQVDPSYQALRVNLRPTEWQSNGGSLQGGHYAVMLTSGAIAGSISANANLFSVRWANNQKFLILKKLNAILMPTAVSSPTMTSLQICRATFTQNPSGTGSTTASQVEKCRTLMAVSDFVGGNSTLVMAGTAALSTNAPTVDSNGFGFINGYAATANQTFVTGDLYKEDAMAEHPFIFGNGEGFVVTTPSGWAASNSQQLWIVMKWIEVPSY